MNPETFSLVIGVLGRWTTYVSLFAVLGSTGAQVIVRHAWHEAGLNDPKPVESRVVRVGVMAALVLLMSAALRLYAQTYSIFGVDEGVTAAGLGIVVFQTAWGAGWMAQFIAAAVALGGLSVWSRLPAMARQVLPVVGAVGIIATLPLTGHAVSRHTPLLAIVLQALHVGAGGLWMGTLGVTLLMIRPGAVRAEEHHAVFANAIRAFSPLAVVAVSMLAVSGIVSAFLYLQALNELWVTTYGRVLCVKVFLFLLTGAIGAYNWRRLKPLLHRKDYALRLRKTASVELTCGALVLATTAILVVLPLID